jgi:hypothetical protein
MTRRRHQRRKTSPLLGRDIALAKSSTVMVTRSEDPFAPVDIADFKRAEQLYAATFDSWEDFDPESR